MLKTPQAKIARNEMTAYTIHEVGNNLELIRLLWATIVNLLLNGGARIDPNKL